MQNIEVTEKDGKLVLTIDPKKRLGPSASGKTTIVATTSGNQSVTVAGQTVTIGVNVYVKPA